MLARNRLAMPEILAANLFFVSLVIGTCRIASAQEYVSIYEPDDDAASYLEDDDYPIPVHPGWPTGITCHDACLACQYEDEFGFPEDDTQVECIISVGDEVLFNETVRWGDGSLHGVFDVVPGNWLDASVIISVNWLDDTGANELSRETTINKSESECNGSTAVESLELDQSHELECHGSSAFLRLTAEQYNQIETVWYRNDVKIDRNDEHFGYIRQMYVAGDGEYPQFDSLKIINASLQTTPGEYHCNLEFDGNSICADQRTICLKQKYEHANEPSIIAAIRTVVVEPGSRAELRCIGQTGTEHVSSSQIAIWLKNGKDVCSNSPHSSNENPACPFEVHRNKDYCNVLSAEEAGDVYNHPLNDNFTATYIIENATMEDAGTYVCKFVSTKNPVNTTVTLLVKNKPTTHRTLTIILIVVGVFVGIALLILLLIHIFWIRVLFYKKKIFGRHHDLANKGYTSYLLYASDAFNNEQNNPVKDVTAWLQGLAYHSFDPNNSGDRNNNGNAPGEVDDNETGRCVANHLSDVLERCLSMIIIITDSLLDQNEDEIFRAYRGLTENARSNLKLIFVCTPQLHRDIKQHASSRKNEKYKTKNEDRKRTCQTFNRFMRLPQNRVVLWKENNKEELNRELYVAVPKTRRRQSITTIV